VGDSQPGSLFSGGASEAFSFHFPGETKYGYRPFSISSQTCQKPDQNQRQDNKNQSRLQFYRAIRGHKSTELAQFLIPSIDNDFFGQNLTKISQKIFQPA
jgi:hypothetical protein